MSSELTREQIEELPRKKIVMMFASPRKSTFQCWQEVDGDRPVNDTSYFHWKKKSNTALFRARPGAVWNVPYDEDNGILYTGQATYSHQFERRDQVEKWLAIHMTNQQKLRMETARSKAMSDDPLRESLSSVREAYLAMNAADRRILLAWVIEFIVRGH